MAAHNAPDRLHPATGHAEPHAVHHHVNYFAVFGVLMVLTIITVAVAFLEIKSEFVKVMLALAIASIKASAVVIYFMHLKFEGKLIYFILFVPLTFVFIVCAALIPDVVLPALKGWNLGRPYPVGH
jgi:cytochrome c oxidase subunit IV